MKISSIFNNKMSFSFEVFPPKLDQPIEPLLETLDELCKLKPDFISCTYGAGGTNKGRNIEVCQAIRKAEIEPMTHFTCIGNTKDDIDKYIREYIDMGMENVLTLRGDFPQGWEETHGAFHHADQLIEYIKEQHPQLCLGAACYPEKHIQADTMEKDIAHLRSKQDHGAEFLMSQICHDVEAYEKFHDKLRKAGVTIPVIVGVMPVLFKDGLIRMTLANGGSIPKELAAIIGKYGNDPVEFKKAGKEYTMHQIYRFINLGIDGIHIYSLNKYKDLAEVVRASGLRR